jgi:hypothetical protein
MKTVISRLLQRAFLLVMLFICVCNYAHATTDPPLSMSLKGALGEIIVGASVVNTDTKFISLAGSIEHTYSLKNTISLYIDPLSTFLIPSDFTTNIKMEVTTTDAQGAINTVIKTLTVNYKKGTGAKYNVSQYYNFENAVIAEIKIIEITADVTWNTTQVLIIKNELTADRDYVFSCSTAIAGLAFGAFIIDNDEIGIKWDDPISFIGQTDYDLEWAWVDASALASFEISAGVYNQQRIFENNASRVTIKGIPNSLTQIRYKIPLLYDGVGKLFVRVRPVQIKNNGQLIEGVWTGQVQGQTTNTTVSFDFTGHSTELNWQASTSYAEEGKHKSVVQYFDGTLRNRQTVTKDNTTQTTVVAETFYDYQGRPVIQVLPSPTLSNIIQYAKNFNRSILGDGYPKSLYDKLDDGQTICSKISPGFSTASGTAQYYSPNNPMLAGGNAGINNFIPNAEGLVAGQAYPYTETRYDPDGSGRVASQGGVGATHQIGSNHETKYKYENVSQTAELDPLFGTDAGISSHYFKNIVKDANGQYSISYADMHGRTIATALAGNNPQNLATIPSYDAARKDVTRDLLPPGTNMVQGKSIKSSQPLVVLEQGDYKFNYELSPDNMILKNCDNTTICYDCLYTLNITVTSDCSPIPIVTKTKKNFTIGQYLKDTYLNNCPPDGKSPSINIPVAEFTQNLIEGSYTVTKELTLSSEGKNYYRDSVYMPANKCKTLLSFVQETLTLLTSNSTCKLTCAQCTTALGSNYQEFRTNMLLKLGVPPAPGQTSPLTAEEIALLEPQFVKAYNEAKASCDKICNGDIDDGFDYIKSIRDAMLLDMVPDKGQYAKYDRAEIPATSSNSLVPAVPYTTFKYNIFNINDNPPANIYNTTTPTIVPHWKNALWLNTTTNVLETVKPYKDLFGQADPINDILSNPTTTYTKEQFGVDFKNSWAESLLPHHPEYCKLRKLEGELRTSFAFEEELKRVTKWQNAYALTYMTQLIQKDPFFSNINGSGAPGAAYVAAMIAKVQVNYRPIVPTITPAPPAPPNLSMWQIAQGIVFCRNNPSATQMACFQAQEAIPTSAHTASACDDWNYAWTIFRTLYLTERKNYISQYLNANCGQLTGTLFTNGTYQLRFQNFSAGAYNTGNNDLNQVLSDIGNGIFTGQNFNTLLGSQADATCRAYASTWINALRKCPTINTALTTTQELIMVNKLVDICKLGYDVSHPMGASSIPPTAPTPPNGFRDFPAVIRDYLNGLGVIAPYGALCNPYLITIPAPYDKAPSLTNEYIITKPTECQCDKLHALQTEHNAHPGSGTFSNYLLTSYGTTISQGALDTLLSLCSNNPITSCNFLPKPIVIPPVLQCAGPIKPCITCQEYAAIKASFFTEFGVNAPILDPITQAELELNEAFARFANIKTGFSKLWVKYRDFELECAATTGSKIANKTLDKNSPIVKAGGGGWTDAACSPTTCSDMLGYYQTYYYGAIVNGGTNEIDLDIRSFYGNVIPCEGEVGVFDVNGSLIGNAVLDPAGNQAYANVWNTSAANNAIGTLSGIPGSCKVRLQLNAVTTTIPCEGIIGMRYYSFTTTNNVLSGMVTGPGCYADFGDGTKIKIHPTISNASTTTTNYANKFLGNSKAYYTTHTFSTATQNTTHTIKVYHSDALGFMGFINTNNDNFKTLKGYAPEQTLRILFKGTKDTSFNTFSKIHNSATFGGLRWVNLGEVNNSTDIPFENFNFGSLSAFSEMEVLLLPNDQLGVTGDINQYYTAINNNPLNFQNLKFLRMRAADFNTSIVLDYPYLRGIEIQQGLTSAQVDQVINQIAQYSIEDNGHAYLSYNNGARTTASNAAYNLLVARGWTIYADGVTTQTLANCTDNIIDDQNYDHIDKEDFATYFTDRICPPNPNGSGIYTVTELNTMLTNCGINPNPCTIPYNPGPLLCGLAAPIAVEDTIKLPDPCAGLDSLALTMGEIKYDIYLDSLRNAFDTAYTNKCMKAGALEKFTVTYSNAEHHYTLYYYDQAGNLIRTVPPEGVKRDDSPGFLASVAAARLAVLNGEEESATNRIVPLHAQNGAAEGAGLVTNYRYNSLNQVVAQKTPDALISKFYYDRLGRLVLSQNAKQKLIAKLSYTQYDYLGRISQVGQIAEGTIPDTRDQTALANWLVTNKTTKEQITRTVYDVSYFSGENPAAISQFLVQKNLRNRVSYSQVFDTEPTGANDNNYSGTHRAATYYSYDIHGNVDTLMQDYGNPTAGLNAMNTSNNRFKKIAYNYDLISGKVNKVSYQPGMQDEFYHRYSYDAENRITMAETSHDDILWERDARYTYYKHGPLARTVIGEQEVQGIDYAYTLQGWLKGVNTTGLQGGDGTIGQGNDCGPNSAVDNLLIYNRETSLPSTYKARTSISILPSAFESATPDNFVASIDPLLNSCDPNGVAGDPIMPRENLGKYDMGQDGRTGGQGEPVITNNDVLYGNNTRTLDAYGYSLNYFNGDYKKITDEAQAPNPFAQITMGAGLPSQAGFANSARDLFNGNIAAMAVSVPKLGTAMVYGYQYDQLNRITAMYAYNGIGSSTNAFTAPTVSLEAYREKISYDANGNILSYKRNGDATRLSMDDMTYSYKPNTNQLDKVVDAAIDIADSDYPKYNDIKRKQPNGSMGQANANYTYDAIGNLISDLSEGISNIEWTVYGKISKIEKNDGKPTIFYTYDASGNRITKQIGTTGLTTYYVRDASGNVMSVYTATPITGPLQQGAALANIKQTEIHLYGSSRLGIYNINRTVTTLDVANYLATNSTFTRGEKFYELSNHLGNVLVTVSDKRIPVDHGTYVKVCTAVYNPITGASQTCVMNLTSLDPDGIIDYYNADVITANDYYPFGMQMPSRKYSQPSSSYRYGFNGQENSDEIGAGLTTAEFWEYDSRIGRRWNQDPILKIWESPYLCFSGNPILLSDYYGLDSDGPGKKETSTKENPTKLEEVVIKCKPAKKPDSKRTLSDYWAAYKVSLKLVSGIQEFDVYASLQLKNTWSRDNFLWTGLGNEGKMVVPFGLQVGYNTEKKGGYYDFIGPKNTYFNYGIQGLVEGRVSKGESDRGDYPKLRGLVTMYNVNGVKLQLDAVFNPKDASSLRIGARAVYEKKIFESNTPLAPSVSVEGAAGFRVKYSRPSWFVGLMPFNPLSLF